MVTEVTARRTLRTDRNRAAHALRASWVAVLAVLCLVGLRWYVVRELIAAWLFFSVLFAAGVILVLAAFLTGEAVERAALWSWTKLRGYCQWTPSTPRGREWVEGLASTHDAGGMGVGSSEVTLRLRESRTVLRGSQ